MHVVQYEYEFDLICTRQHRLISIFIFRSLNYHDNTHTHTRLTFRAKFPTLGNLFILFNLLLL